MNVLDLSEVDFFCQMMNCYDKECGASEYLCNDDYLKFTKDNKALFRNKNVDNTIVCSMQYLYSNQAFFNISNIVLPTIYWVKRVEILSCIATCIYLI